MNTRSLRPWWRRVVKGYRASMKLGQLAQVPVLTLSLPLLGGSLLATSYTLAGLWVMMADLRPMFRRRLRERGWMPSARPGGVGSARLSMCLILYPHRARIVDSMRPAGPAPTITWTKRLSQPRPQTGYISRATTYRYHSLCWRIPALVATPC